MNPNAVPSRMTIGQLWECLMGKVGALKGVNMDGTPFEEYDIESIKDILESMGYNRNGTEYLYNGMTGKLMQAEIFIGPTYYQRLKHMTKDKIKEVLVMLKDIASLVMEATYPNCGELSTSRLMQEHLESHLQYQVIMAT